MIERTQYMASDGSMFDSPEVCKEYEKNLVETQAIVKAFREARSKAMSDLRAIVARYDGEAAASKDIYLLLVKLHPYKQLRPVANAIEEVLE